MLEFWDEDYNEWQAGQLFIQIYTNQTTSWLMHSWNIFGARMSHKHTWTHKIHHSSDWGEATTFPPYSILCAWPWGLHPNVILSRDSQARSLEIPKIRTFTTLEAHNFLCKPSIEVNFKENYSPCWELSKDMWHATCIQVNQGDYWLLMIESQISTLTLGPSFGHNLCYKYVLKGF